MRWISGRRLARLGLLGGLVAASAWAFVVASQARTPAQRANLAATPPASVITAPVEKGSLVDAVTVNGVWSRESLVTINGPAPATGVAKQVVTKIPVKVGDEVRVGKVVAEVSGRPIIALPGNFPAYRDLTNGDTGPDVRQVQTALKGSYGTPVNGTLDARTAADIERLYRAAGYSVPRVANGGAEASATSTPGSTGTPPPAKPALRVPAGELLFVSSLPATVGSVPAHVGGDGTGALVTLAGGGWRVAVPLNAETKRLLEPAPTGARFLLGAAEDGTGAPVRLLEVRATPTDPRAPTGAAQPDPAAGRDGEGREAVFAVDAPPPSAEIGRAQSVSLERGRSPEGALLVPASALWTSGDGTVSVTVVADDRTTRKVTVTVLLSVRGRVAVQPKDGELPVGTHVAVAALDGKQPGG
jgi:hypothetical protein